METVVLYPVYRSIAGMDAETYSCTNGKGITFKPGFDEFSDGKVFIGNNVQLFDLFINSVNTEIYLDDNVFFSDIELC